MPEVAFLAHRSAAILEAANPSRYRPHAQGATRGQAQPPFKFSHVLWLVKKADQVRTGHDPVNVTGKVRMLTPERHAPLELGSQAWGNPLKGSK